MNETKNKPLMSAKVGAVRAAVWRNQRQNGDGQGFESVRVVIDRTYRDRNGSYGSTHSLGPNDIPKAIFALMKAYEYLTTHQDGDDTEGEEDSSPPSAAKPKHL